MLRLDSFLASGLIALSGCATAAQSQVQQKPAIQNTYTELQPGQSVCDYMRMNGMNDPSTCREDKEFEEILRKLSEGVAAIVAESYWAQSAEHVQRCLHTQQYDLTTPEERKEKCTEEVLDIIDNNANFQKIDPEMQEMIRDKLRRNILER